MHLERVEKPRWKLTVCLLDCLLCVIFYNRSIFQKLFFLSQNLAQIFLTGSCICTLTPTILSTEQQGEYFQNANEAGSLLLEMHQCSSYIWVFVFFPQTLLTNSFFSFSVFFPRPWPTTSLALPWCGIYQGVSYLSFLTHLNITFSAMPFLILFPSFRTPYKFLSKLDIIHSNLCIWIMNGSFNVCLSAWDLINL